MEQTQHYYHSIGMGRTLRSRTSNYYAVLADTSETTRSPKTCMEFEKSATGLRGPLAEILVTGKILDLSAAGQI